MLRTLVRRKCIYWLFGLFMLIALTLMIGLPYNFGLHICPSTLRMTSLLRMIDAAEQIFYERSGRFATLNELLESGILEDPQWLANLPHEYDITISVEGNTWHAVAHSRQCAKTFIIRRGGLPEEWF